MSARLWRLALPFYWALLAFSTHYPSVYIPTNITYRDKVVHCCAFGGLAFLYWQFAETRKRPLTSTFVWSAAVVLLAYAAIDEYTQQFFGRDTDILDFLADLIGVTSMLTVLEWRRRRPSRS